MKFSNQMDGAALSVIYGQTPIIIQMNWECSTAGRPDKIITTIPGNFEVSRDQLRQNIISRNL